MASVASRHCARNASAARRLLPCATTTSVKMSRCLSSTYGPTVGTSGQKKLFTPGPLGVSYDTKEAMLIDLGSRDKQFIGTVAFIRKKLLELANVSADDFTALPVQGSGTYAVESVVTSTVPRNGGKMLIMANGAYGNRIVSIADVLGVDKIVIKGPENGKADLQALVEALKRNPDVTNVVMVHCETSSGVIHPVEEAAALVREHSPQATFFVDAMSSFGSVPISLENIDFMVSSANKCIEGVPGFSFVVARKKALELCKGYSRSLSLDLVDQYHGLEKNGQFRFTPATHAMLAFKKALELLDSEGGVEGRGNRYRENCRVLRSGMATMGFKEFLDNNHAGYIITSYRFPKDPNFKFDTFYEKLNERGQVIYPGKVTEADCFRIGSIGHLFPSDMEHLLTCIRDVCSEMEISLPLS